MKRTAVRICRLHGAKERDLRRRGNKLGAFCRVCFAAAWKRHRAKDPEKWRAIDRRRYWRKKLKGAAA